MFAKKNSKEHLLPLCSAKTMTDMIGSLSTFVLHSSLFSICMIIIYFTNCYFTQICTHLFTNFLTYLFQFRVTGGQSLSQQLRVQGGTHPGQDAIPSQGTSTLTHRDPEDCPIHLKFTSLVCGRKLEYLEKTYTDVGRACKLHTSGPSWESIIFSSSML